MPDFPDGPPGAPTAAAPADAAGPSAAPAAPADAAGPSAAPAAPVDAAGPPVAPAPPAGAASRRPDRPPRPVRREPRLRLALPVFRQLDPGDPESGPLIGPLTELADLLEIKFPYPPGWLPASLPRVFHWNLGPVEREFGRSFPEVGRLLARGGFGMFSADLGPAASARDGCSPLSPTLAPEAIVSRLRRGLGLIRRSFSGPVALENYNYYPTGLYEHVCSPAFIARALGGLELGLVLDLAHAAITARNLGLGLMDYVRELPLGRVAEIHLSRPELPPDPSEPAVDAHGPPGPAELGALAETLDLLEPFSSRPGRLPPVAVVEHYTDPGALLAAMRLVKEMA